MAEPSSQPSQSPRNQVNILLPGSWLEGADPDAVDRIVRALYADPATRTAIEAAWGSAATGEQRYVSLSDLQGQEAAPPAGVPFLNEAIGVLSVPAPPGGKAAVEAAITAVAPPGTQVEEAVEERALGGQEVTQ